jgi:glycosyltransferase involved in cell wall biosynthesis
MKNVNANLMIIGNGLLHDKLQELIKKNNLGGKIIIKKSVPHNQIQNYYKSADIFALAYNPEIEGIPMPVMEAMATGLAIVIPPSKEKFSEKLEGSVIFAESNPNSFARSINELLDDKLLHKKFADRAKIKALEFDIEKIEKREAEIYTELVSIKN